MQPDQEALEDLKREVKYMLHRAAKRELLNHDRLSFNQREGEQQKSEQQMVAKLETRTGKLVEALASYANTHDNRDALYIAMKDVLAGYAEERRNNPGEGADVKTRTQEYLLQKTLAKLNREKGFEPTDFSSL